MNTVSLIGRLARDVDIRDGEITVGRFTLAVNRMKKDDPADFISCVCFGKTAENMKKYTAKGSQVGVTGRIQTGSYEKDGRTVYTTDVIAANVEFLGSRKESQNEAAYGVSGFHEMSDDDYDDSNLPF